MESNWERRGNAEDSRGGPVDRLKGNFRFRYGCNFVSAKMGELLLRVRSRGFAEDGERSAEGGELRSARGAGAEMSLQAGEVAAEGMGGASENHVAELFVG